MVHFDTPLRHPPALFTAAALVIITASLNMPWLVLFFASGQPEFAWLCAAAIALFYLARSCGMGLFAAITAYNRMDARIRESENFNANASRMPDTKPILHVVLITCYKEPVELIRATMLALAEQKVPMAMLLALEERDAGARERYESVVDEVTAAYPSTILGVHISVHPPGVAGELPGKCSNANFAVRQFYEHEADKYEAFGYPLSSMIITSCDSDSLFSSHYFTYLNKLIEVDTAGSDSQAAHVWVPTVVHIRNALAWDNIIPYYVSWIRMYLYASGVRWGPDVPRGFISNYHIPLLVMRDVAFWTPDVIAEDIHFFHKLKAFATHNTSIYVNAPYESLSIHMVHLPSDNQTPNHPESIISTASELFWQNVRWMYYQTEAWFWSHQYFSQQWRSAAISFSALASITFNSWDLFYACPFLPWTSLAFFCLAPEPASDWIQLEWTHFKYVFLALKLTEAFYPALFQLATQQIVTRDKAMKSGAGTASSAHLRALFFAAWPIAAIVWINIVIPLTTLIALKKCLMAQAVHDTSATKSTQPQRTQTVHLT